MKVLIHWHGYADAIWEPMESLQETEAMEVFKSVSGPIMGNYRPLERYQMSTSLWCHG